MRLKKSAAFEILLVFAKVILGVYTLGNLAGIEVLGKITFTGNGSAGAKSNTKEISKVIVLLLVLGISRKLCFNLILNLVLGRLVKVRGRILNSAGKVLVLLNRLGYGAKTYAGAKNRINRLNKLFLGTFLRLGNDVKKTGEGVCLLLNELISCCRLFFLSLIRVILLVLLDTFLKLVEVGTCNVNDKVVYSFGRTATLRGSFLRNVIVGI